jgi:hypothetical protein
MTHPKNDVEGAQWRDHDRDASSFCQVLQRAPQNAIVLPKGFKQRFPNILRSAEGATNDVVIDRDQGGSFSGEQFACRHPANPVLALQQTPDTVGGPAVLDQISRSVIPQRHSGRNLTEEQRCLISQRSLKEIERHTGRNLNTDQFQREDV